MRIPTSPGASRSLNLDGNTTPREVPGDVAHDPYPWDWCPGGSSHPLQPEVESPFASSQARTVDLSTSLRSGRHRLLICQLTGKMRIPTSLEGARFFDQAGDKSGRRSRFCRVTTSKCQWSNRLASAPAKSSSGAFSGATVACRGCSHQANNADVVPLCELRWPSVPDVLEPPLSPRERPQLHV
jgi:hypothetical protein